MSRLQNSKIKTQNFTSRGFTLVELMVSVSVFVIVMVISMGSILSIFDANKKSQTLRTVMDNLNFSLEAMTRTIRFGTNYYCGDSSFPPSGVSDCSGNNPSSAIVVKSAEGIWVKYKLDNGRIKRYMSTDLDSNGYYVTSSDVTITSLKYWVYGSTPFAVGSDTAQPQAIITIGGYAGQKATTKSSFSLQTTVSQRLFDSQ